jgi:transcriptional regulator with XRE-family HTH domain
MLANRLTNLREAHPLRIYRQRHQLSLAQLGARAGLSRAGLSRIESAEITPSLRAMVRLGAATRGEVSEIDIFRYHLAAAGVVPGGARITRCYRWRWVTPPGAAPKLAGSPISTVPPFVARFKKPAKTTAA